MLTDDVRKLAKEVGITKDSHLLMMGSTLDEIRRAVRKLYILKVAREKNMLI